jgi:Leucine-rich repeat (LRR) protein
MKKESLLFFVSLAMLLTVFYLLLGQRGNSFLPDKVERILDSKGEIQTPVVSKDKVLDLSNKGLEKVPTYVFDMNGLEELNLSHNSLVGAIPAEIRHLKNLKVLRVNDNLMTGVPAEVGQLSKLEELDFSNNQLTGLPNELGNLKNLKIFNLSGNNYSAQDMKYIQDRLPGTKFILN